jgi:hypothetical protein
MLGLSWGCIMKSRNYPPNAGELIHKHSTALVGVCVFGHGGADLWHPLAHCTSRGSPGQAAEQGLAGQATTGRVQAEATHKSSQD